MSIDREREDLRNQLASLASEADRGLVQRYALRPLPSERPNLYRRFRRSIGLTLRWIGLRKSPPLEPWLTELHHVDYGEGSRPLLIWAFDIDRGALRTACRRLEACFAATPGWAPVLVTDVADFAFFSRLNWLVEYVPVLSSPAEPYFKRKQRYLAWRYRDIPALPASAALDENVSLEGLLVG